MMSAIQRIKSPVSAIGLLTTTQVISSHIDRPSYH